MRILNILLLTATIAALSSCSKKSDSADPIKLPGNATAYVAGATGDTAVYFVNGKEYTLTSGKTPAAANSLAISGSGIYVAGYESNGAHTVAKYWKNGVATVLSDTSTNASATAIAVSGSGSDVYVAGWVSIGSTTAAALWKNGTLKLLSAAGHGGAANALCIDNGDVYIAGCDSAAGQAAACYWKNGAMNTLPDSLSFAVARGIAVNLSDVYVVGYDCSPDEYSYIGPRLWKNGSIVQLPVSSTYYSGHNAIATSVAVTGNTTYVGGQDFFRAAYWQNGTENFVDGSQCNAVAVENGDIYLAGYANALANTNGSSAVFWRNGIILPLDYSAATANAIVVTN